MGHLGAPWGLRGALMGHLGAFLGHGLPILGQLGHFWAFLGAFWAPFWPISGPSWSHLGVIRGPSWGYPLILWANRRALHHRGLILGSRQPPRPQKSSICPLFFEVVVFGLVASIVGYKRLVWDILGLSWPFWRPLGRSWRHLGALLGLPWPPLGPSWAIMGRSWGAYLGVTLGPV